MALHDRTSASISRGTDGCVACCRPRPGFRCQPYDRLVLLGLHSAMMKTALRDRTIVLASAGYRTVIHKVRLT